MKFFRFEWIYQKRKHIVSVVILALVLAGSFFAWRFFEKKQNEKAENQIYLMKHKLFEAEKKHGGNVLDPASPFYFQKKAEDFSLFSTPAEEYKNWILSQKKVGAVHWAGAVELAYFLMKYDQEKSALELLSALSLKTSPDSWLKSLALVQLAGFFMNEGNCTRSLHLLSQVLAQSALHTEALIRTALCYEFLKKYDKAHEVYTLIQTQQDSLYKERALNLNRLLKIKRKLKGGLE